MEHLIFMGPNQDLKVNMLNQLFLGGDLQTMSDQKTGQFVVRLGISTCENNLE